MFISQIQNIPRPNGPTAGILGPDLVTYNRSYVLGKLLSADVVLAFYREVTPPMRVLCVLCGYYHAARTTDHRV